MNKIKLLLISFLFSSFLFSMEQEDFNIVEKMNDALKKANKYRFLAIEFVEILKQDFIEKKAEFDLHKKQEKEEIMLNIKQNKELILENINAINKYNSDLELIKIEIEQLQQVKKDNFRKRQRKNAISFNQSAYDDLLVKESSILKQIELRKKLINTAKTQIKEAQNKLKSINSDKFIDNSHILIEAPAECMPIFRLFDKNISEENFLVILDSIIKDLFLTPQYFTNLDENTLNMQAEHAQKSLAIACENININNAPVGINAKHIKHFLYLMKEIYTIFEYEKIRRTVKADILEKAYANINDNLKMMNDYIGIRKNLIEMMTDIIDIMQGLKINWETNNDIGKVYEVTLHKRVINSIDSDQEQEKINRLVEYLQTKFSISKEDEINNGWSNFSSLSKNDYHCHLGSSNRVVVWKVLHKENKIIVYYLGGHPNNYKSITKKADNL